MFLEKESTSLSNFSKGHLQAYIQRAGHSPDDKLELMHVALACAGLQRSQTDLSHYFNHLSNMSKDLAQTLSVLETRVTSLRDKIKFLHEVFYDVYGYQGDQKSFEDLRNIDLMHVIDRRLGVPISLGILYIHLARSVGWRVDGLNFPGHFLVRVTDGMESLIIDPYHRGRTYNAIELRGLIKVAAGLDSELKPQHYASASNRAILLRLQNNLKIRLVSRGAFEEALKILDTMMWISPQRPDLWYESGFILAEMGELNKALDKLERALQLSVLPEDRMKVMNLMHNLQGKRV